MRISDILWFLSRWHPISVKWRSPRMLWRMAMRRKQIESIIIWKRVENIKHELEQAEQEET